MTSNKVRLVSPIGSGQWKIILKIDDTIVLRPTQ
jgi:hypothetical protein